MLRKILSLTLSISLLFQYSGFAQSINLADYLSQGHKVVALDRFRPLALRYFSYEPSADNFKILLDKGDQKNLSDAKINAEADRLLTYFKIGLTLPNEKFWVNLRPDAADQIIDPELEKTDLGKVLLEADLQLKKDTSSLTSPQSKEGKAYWDKLYKKAGELFGTENITIPTITRPWIVPGEIIVRESKDSAYIYKAVLKVMLEEDYLSRGGFEPAPTYKQYAFSDPRLKELNKYSTELIRETILPELTKRINSSKDYANLRQVFFSLILARWFKDTFGSSGSARAPEHQSQENSYIRLIDSGDLNNLTSKESWSKTAYFNEYKKSFKDGEYNLSEKVYTPTGQSIRRYTSGGHFYGKMDLHTFDVPEIGSSSIDEGRDNLIPLKIEKNVPVIIPGQKIQKTAASAIVEEEKLPLTTPRLNFSDLKSLEASLKGIVEEVSPGVIYAGIFQVINETALKNELIDKLVYDATFNPNQDIVNETRRLIKGIAVSLGAKPDSTYNLYLEKAKDSRHYTIPAINIRGMAYNTARAVFESAVRNKVEDPFILEIARSEIGYTAQRPAEYTTSVLAAAIKEGYKLPVYLQGDHFQITAKEYKENLPAAMEKVQKLIREAIEAGFYQIDLDTSTLVDWSKPTADEQQNLNYTMAAKLTAYVRQLEKDLGLDKQGIVVNLGGEIGEIGMGLEKGKERNSSVEDLRAFMNGYNFELERLGRKLGFRLNPITKVAVQSGTKHGGVRDSAGKVIKAKVGFNTLAELGKAAREEFGLAGVVQHGASTLPEDYFTVFAGNKMPAGLTIDESLLNQEGQTTLDSHPVAEVHLATAYQDTVLDHPEFPADLREEIVKRILEWNPPKEGQDPNKVFVDNRKNAWGEFKLQTWNMPSDIQTAMRNSLRAQFDTVFKNLGVASSAVEAGDVSDLEKVEVSKWIDRVHRYAWLKAKIEHHKKELEKLSGEVALYIPYIQGVIKVFERELRELGNPDDSIPEALKKAEEQKREYVVAGNGKMAINTKEGALDIVRDIAREIRAKDLFDKKDNWEYIDIVIPIAPSFIHISAVNAEIKRLGVEGMIRLAAQDVSSEGPGAWTGQISAKQLEDAGVEYVILGHSERRRILNETSKIVNTKVKKALENNLKPILCVGESLDEREAGKTFSIIAEQTLDSLKNLNPEQIQEIVIAYEPVWAIGTGRTATPGQANEVHRFIRALLLNAYGYETASKTRILYGGSVKADNIASLIVQPSIDGGLIGGAFLKPGDFVTIIEESLKHFRAASSAMMTKETVTNPTIVGGIDFRQMNMLIQPQGSFASSSLDFSLPALSKAEIEAFDLDKELELIQRMASSGIDPIDERFKKYLAVCFARGKTGKEIDELKLCLEDVFTAQQLDARETPDGYKEVIVIADTRRYVLKESRLAVGKSYAINLN